jgi:hypothetical protein
MATKKEIADDKRTAKAQKRTDEFEKNLASMSPRNKEHFEKFIAAKNKPKVISQAAPVTLSPEREQQLANWKQKEAADEAVLRDWGQRLSVARKKVVKLNEQYRDLLYKFIQEAYAVYKEVVAHELADDFFAAVRGELLKQDFKVQSNTPDASLIIRLVFGVEATNKSVSEYGKVLTAAVARNIAVDAFAEWLKKETLTKVLSDQRAVEADAETPKVRLDRARRVILRMLDIREAVPIIRHTTTAHNAEQMLGRHYGLCVAIGHASRRMDRDSFYADVNFSLIMPVSLDFEIYIVDKLSRYILRELEAYEAKIDKMADDIWADEVYERLVAASEEEIEANNVYWANRQQAQMYEDQQDFLQVIKNKNKKSIK